jgi:hypothetical protein
MPATACRRPPEHGRVYGLSWVHPNALSEASLHIQPDTPGTVRSDIPREIARYSHSHYSTALPLNARSHTEKFRSRAGCFLFKNH